MTVTYDSKRDKFYITFGETEYVVYPSTMREIYGEIRDAINLRKSLVDGKE